MIKILWFININNKFRFSPSYFALKIVLIHFKHNLKAQFSFMRLPTGGTTSNYLYKKLPGLVFISSWGYQHTFSRKGDESQHLLVSVIESSIYRAFTFCASARKFLYSSCSQRYPCGFIVSYAHTHFFNAK